MQKKKRVEQAFKKISSVPGLSDSEKWMFAKSLTATPDERWQMHENFLHSLGLYKRSERIKFGFK